MDYIAFLRYCLESDGNSLVLKDAKNIDWRAMLLWAERQSIVGIIFNGIQKSGKSLDIPTDILYKWIGYVNQIEHRNRLSNKRCVELTEFLKHRGFDACILKGQGNALLYPNPLWRTPGDIDVWTRKKSIRETIKFALKKNPNSKACYHHVDYGDYEGVEVEIHYRPSFMFSPVCNYRLQRWFSKMADGGCLMTELPDEVGSICVPGKGFNIVFQLVHVYNHLLHEGIGLRQIVDYYYLLKSDGRGKKDEVSDTLQYLGLSKIAGAMMWVLNKMLGLPEEYLIVPVDEKRGKVLWAEIMRGGNFGHYDVENQKANNAIKKNLQRIKRDIRMMRYFPSECLWEPVFRLYHFFWRTVYR